MEFPIIFRDMIAVICSCNGKTTSGLQGTPLACVARPQIRSSDVNCPSQMPTTTTTTSSSMMMGVLLPIICSMTSDEQRARQTDCCQAGESYDRPGDPDGPQVPLATRQSSLQRSEIV